MHFLCFPCVLRDPHVILFHYTNIKINLVITYTEQGYVKLSLYSLKRSLGLHEFEATRISRQSIYEGGKVVSSTHWPPLLPGDIPGTYLETQSNPGP